MTLIWVYNLNPEKTPSIHRFFQKLDLRIATAHLDGLEIWSGPCDSIVERVLACACEIYTVRGQLNS